MRSRRASPAIFALARPRPRPSSGSAPTLGSARGAPPVRAMQGTPGSVRPRLPAGRVPDLPVLDPGQPHPPDLRGRDIAQLGRGIQGWSVRVARGLNGHLGRTGSVFDDRYHLEILTTPTQTRHALCYVLQSARRHGEPIEPRFGGMDPFSSAWCSTAGRMRPGRSASRRRRYARWRWRRPGCCGWVEALPVRSALDHRGPTCGPALTRRPADSLRDVHQSSRDGVVLGEQRRCYVPA